MGATMARRRQAEALKKKQKGEKPVENTIKSQPEQKKKQKGEK